MCDYLTLNAFKYMKICTLKHIVSIIYMQTYDLNNDIKVIVGLLCISVSSKSSSICLNQVE